jgi:hypothetical protein
VCLTLILGFFFTHRVLVLVNVRAVDDALLHALQVTVYGKVKHVPRGLRLNAQQQMTARGETQEPVAEEKTGRNEQKSEINKLSKHAEKGQQTAPVGFAKRAAAFAASIAANS